MTITGFKSTDIESRSKVEPATVTNFGYKRQGLDVNAMTGLFLVTAATCSAGTTSSIAVMSPASTVRAGDVLDFNGIRSEISLVSGTSYTLGRAVTGLTTASSVNIYRPSYILLDSTGAISIAGTPNINLAQVGGVATSLGQKAEASSIPVVLATEQDTAKDGSETSQGQFTGIGVLKTAPFEGNPAWAGWPASEEGIPYIAVFGFDESTQVQARINSSITNVIANGSSLRGIFTRSFIQGPDSSNTSDLRTAYIATTTPGSSDPGIVARTIPSGIQAISRTVNSATFEPYGKVDGSALTTSYQDLLGMAGDAAVLRLFNSTEVPVIISLDAGSTDCEELGPYENISIDYYANDLILPADTIRVKLVSGSAPTNGGSVRASVTR